MTSLGAFACALQRVSGNFGAHVVVVSWRGVVGGVVVIVVDAGDIVVSFAAAIGDIVASFAAAIGDIVVSFAVAIGVKSFKE